MGTVVQRSLEWGEPQTRLSESVHDSQPLMPGLRRFQQLQW